MYDELVIKANAIQAVNAGNLVNKTDYATKIGQIEKKVTGYDHNNKYITTQEFNK